jgi:acyl carrier protein
MPQQFSANVLQTLADHLGVPAREILLTHDLYRDWGLTPLALVVVLLDLERVADIELPSQELGSVRTVADLVLKFRTWVRQSDTVGHPLVRTRARRSRTAQSARRIRRELHHLRWLERGDRAATALHDEQTRNAQSAMRRAASR